MSRLDELNCSWTLESINKWASDEFPDAFKAASAATTHITFEDLADEAEFCNMVSDAPFKRPEAVGKVLQVGHARFSGLYFNVYVFICGDNRNMIEFMYKLDKADYFIKLSFSHHAKRIQTEYPFSRCNYNDTPPTARRKLRAFIVYLFVAHGLLDGVQYFSTFLEEFKSACEWILHNPGPTQPVSNASIRTIQTNRIPASLQDPQDDEEVFVNATKSRERSNNHSLPLKRGRDDDSGESTFK